MTAASARVKATVVQRLGADAFGLFQEALEAAGFWRQLEQTRRKSGLRRDRFDILIKPDLDSFSPSSPNATDPRLVEHLIDLLHDRGYRRVRIGDGRSDRDTWLHNREPLVVPDLLGYRFTTDQGRSYEIVDLHEAKGPAEASGPGPGGASDPGPSGGAGASDTFSRHWVEANFRINFAKNRTHEECLFALCVQNLAGIAGSRKLDAPEACIEVLRLAPPHFNLIDAFTSCHGGAGQRAPRALQTHTFIASPDALLADWAAAAKMGLDPHGSPINDKCLRGIGLPEPHEIEGDLSPYARWHNVHPLLAHSARLRRRSNGLGDIVEAWFQCVDRESFPFKDFYNDRVNSFVTPWMEELDENPRSFWGIVLFNYLIARIGSGVLAHYTLFAKSRLRRQVAPLELDLEDHPPGGYASIPSYLAPYERLLEDSPANRMGLRWRHVGGTILFSCSHVFPVPFERFVQRVDICRSIQYMNDYIGGSTVTVRRDGRGRVTHQAERNLYLQQPNWMVLFGGELIDVEKLEFVEYKRGRQNIYWRTVGSPNGSAAYDDGRVTFERSGSDQTQVTIFARQQFSLPLFFQVFDVQKTPEIRDPIIERAYTTYFEGTLANLQAEYEGREFRIGHAAVDGEADEISGLQDLVRYLATAAAAVAELLRHRKDVLDFSEWLLRSETPPGAPGTTGGTTGKADDDGFRHFGPSPDGTQYTTARSGDGASVAGIASLMRDAPDLLDGLAGAIRKDLHDIAATAEDGYGS